MDEQDLLYYNTHLLHQWESARWARLLLYHGGYMGTFSSSGRRGCIFADRYRLACAESATDCCETGTHSKAICGSIGRRVQSLMGKIKDILRWLYTYYRPGASSGCAKNLSAAL